MMAMKNLHHAAIASFAAVAALFFIATAAAAQSAGEDRTQLAFVLAPLPETWVALTASLRSSVPAPAPATVRAESAPIEERLSILRRRGRFAYDDYAIPSRRDSSSSGVLKEPRVMSRMLSKREFVSLVLTKAGAVLPPFRGAADMYHDFDDVTHGDFYNLDLDVNPLKDRYRFGVTIRLP